MTSATATVTRWTYPCSAAPTLVYHYNYPGGPSEAVEDHMHQIKAVLRHVNPHLFWDKFVGRPGEGRCGWAHYPRPTTTHRLGLRATPPMSGRT